MPLSRILRYLIGDADAIHAMARDKSAIKYGLLFVLFAGVAREYDQESLFYRPGLFLAPLIASIILALMHFGYLRVKYRPKDVNGLSGFRCYLGLFWMTAPLAMFYALPVEYFFDALTALKINTALLAIVASWRVILYARVMSITLKQPFWLMLCEILWGGCVLVLVIGALFSFSLTDVMGGSVHSQETAFKSNTLSLTTEVSFWLGWVMFAVQFKKGNRPRTAFPPPEQASPFRFSIAMALFLLATSMLLLRQPSLYRSAELNYLIRTDTEKGMDFMAAHSPQDFARTWPLPPAGRSQRINLFEAVQMLEQLKPHHPAWISEEILDYVDRYLDGTPRFLHPWQLTELIALLPKTSAADKLLNRHSEFIRNHFSMMDGYSGSAEEDALYMEAKTRLQQLEILEQIEVE